MLIDIIKRLKHDNCWKTAKRKSGIIIQLTLILYIPFIILDVVMFAGNKSLPGLIILSIIFITIPLYCKGILCKMVDNWYSRR